MGQSRFLAHPLWVNFLVLVPLALCIAWRNKGIQIPGQKLFFATIFAIAFGFVEAATATYLSAAAGLLPGYTGTLSDVQRLARSTEAELPPINQFPPSLLTIEVLREGATIVMLAGIALLAASKARERCAVFLWTFAWWDISYYAGLWGTVRWPTSLKDLDVLFLIPEPWIAPVWFPLLVSVLTLVALELGRRQMRV